MAPKLLRPPEILVPVLVLTVVEAVEEATEGAEEGVRVLLLFP